jgi:hypothetical protein
MLDADGMGPTLFTDGERGREGGTRVENLSRLETGAGRKGQFMDWIGAGCRHCKDRPGLPDPPHSTQMGQARAPPGRAVTTVRLGFDILTRTRGATSEFYFQTQILAICSKMKPKRRRVPTSPLELANRKTDEQFVADYFQSRSALFQFPCAVVSLARTSRKKDFGRLSKHGLILSVD